MGKSVNFVRHLILVSFDRPGHQDAQRSPSEPPVTPQGRSKRTSSDVTAAFERLGLFFCPWRNTSETSPEMKLDFEFEIWKLFWYFVPKPNPDVFLCGHQTQRTRHRITTQDYQVNRDALLYLAVYFCQAFLHHSRSYRPRKKPDPFPFRTSFFLTKIFWREIFDVIL